MVLSFNQGTHISSMSCYHESVILQKQEIGFMLLEDKIDADFSLFFLIHTTENPGHYTYNKCKETMKGGEKAVNCLQTS